MGEFSRGLVTKLTAEIVYPDGSRKTEELEDPESIALIALNRKRVPDQDADVFDVSDSDWKQNPAMLIYKKDADVSVQGIPFCTHNGCKK